MKVCARIVVVVVVLVGLVAQGGEPAADPVERDVTQGALRIVQDQGQVVECPLKHTDVKADQIDWSRAVVDSASVRAVFGGPKPAPIPLIEPNLAANTTC